MFRVGAVVIPLFAVGWAYLTRGEPGSEGMVFIIPIALLLGLAFWRLGRVEAHTDDDGIWVTNVFRRYHIPWSEIERIDSEEQGSLFGTRRATICVARKTGEKVKVSACSSTRDLSRLSTLARERGPGPGTAPSPPQTEAEGRLPEASAPATREPPKDTEQETPTDQSDQWPYREGDFDWGGWAQVQLVFAIFAWPVVWVVMELVRWVGGLIMDGFLADCGNPDVFGWGAAIFPFVALFAMTRFESIIRKFSWPDDAHAGNAYLTLCDAFFVVVPAAAFLLS